jgi:hypothetical protein
MGEYRKCVLTAAVFLISCQAISAESKDISYYCTKDATGGVRYNEKTKKWEATNFKPDGNFVLKMQYLRSYANKAGFGSSDITEYTVTVTIAGSKYAAPCSYDYFYAHTGREIVPLTNNRLRCDASLVDYTFDLDSNRFLATYLQGYTDGIDNNENTPSISAGTCTKID